MCKNKSKLAGIQIKQQANCTKAQAYFQVKMKYHTYMTVNIIKWFMSLKRLKDIIQQVTRLLQSLLLAIM